VDLKLDSTCSQFSSVVIDIWICE